MQCGMGKGSAGEVKCKGQLCVKSVSPYNPPNRAEQTRCCERGLRSKSERGPITVLKTGGEARHIDMVCGRGGGNPLDAAQSD